MIAFIFTLIFGTLTVLSDVFAWPDWTFWLCLILTIVCFLYMLARIGVFGETVGNAAVDFADFGDIDVGGFDGDCGGGDGGD